MTKRNKITYLLGAGASFNAVPIWNEQGLTMQEMGFRLKTKFKNSRQLRPIFEAMEKYGKYALEYGTIDIYARKLFLNNKPEELNQLKLVLSLYLDIWENFEELRNEITSNLKSSKKLDEDRKYDAIDKRYYALLSVILDSSNEHGVAIDDNVNFITWNYDLQLESAFESFLMKKSDSMQDLNRKIKFLNDTEDLVKNKIIHLNGMRGCFESEGKFEDIVERSKIKNDLSTYLAELNKIVRTRNSKSNMQNAINYAWEGKDNRVRDAIKVLEATDVLVVIGYSFPSFNKLVDFKLINAFSKKGKLIFYQDIKSDFEIIRFSKIHKNKFKQITDCNQFLLPNEFFPNLSTDNKYRGDVIIY